MPSLSPENTLAPAGLSHVLISLESEFKSHSQIYRLQILISKRGEVREGDPSDAAFFVVNWQMGENVIMQQRNSVVKGHER